MVLTYVSLMMISDVEQLFLSLLANCIPSFESIYAHVLPIFKWIVFIHLTEIETASERENTSTGSGRGRSRLPEVEPDEGLDPRMLGSRPVPKAVA